MLIVNDRDMRFIYRLAKLKRLVYDGKVLCNKIETKLFKIPIDNYYLGVTGYLNIDYFLIYYKKV